MRRLAAAWLTLSLAGSGLAFPAAAEPAAAERLHALFEEEWRERLETFPLFATYVGEHAYGDRLGEVGVEAALARAERLRHYLGRLERIERSELGAADRVHRDVFHRMLADELAEIEHRGYFFPITNREGFHLDFARLPDQLSLRSAQDYERYLARLRAFRGWVGEHLELLRAAIEAGYTLPRVVLEGYDETIRAHVVDDPEESRLFEPFERFPEGVSEADRARLAEAGRRAIATSVVPGYRDFLSFFLDEYLPASRASVGVSELDGGEAFYAHRVRYYTSLEVTPREVHEIGLAEVARIRGEMEEVLAEVGYAGRFEAFLEHLRSDPRFYPSSPEELLREAAWISKRMDGELPRLFRKLPRTPYGLEPIPDYIAPKTTGAYYSQPAGDGTRAGTYFLNTYDLPSRPLYTLEALSFHEAVPGHHLQLALQQELEGLPPFRRFNEINAFVEGWALYAERLGLEVGFYQEPTSNFGRLTYEMWRACRLVVDTGLHALGWSRQRAIDFLASNTALSLHEVTTEIDRYVAWPGQALGYKMGELEIRRLRALAEAELGDRFDVRVFHDVVLRNGSLPLTVLAREVEGWIAAERGAGAP